MMGIKVWRILSVITVLALSFALVGHASAGAPQYPISEDTEVILPAPEIPAEDTVEIPLPIVPESEEPTEALTPEGNMTLVDDVETETETTLVWEQEGRTLSLTAPASQALALAESVEKIPGE